VFLFLTLICPSETIVELSPTAAPAFRPSSTRAAIGDAASALAAPPVSRTGSGGAAARSAGSATADVLSPLRALDRSPAGTIAGESIDLDRLDSCSWSDVM
jgi:hypothetical protein